MSSRLKENYAVFRKVLERVMRQPRKALHEAIVCYDIGGHHVLKTFKSFLDAQNRSTSE